HAPGRSRQRTRAGRADSQSAGRRATRAHDTPRPDHQRNPDPRLGAANLEPDPVVKHAPAIRKRGGRLRARGAALLVAMLTVALVATFASAALWQQWRSVEVETAERARIQSDWILTGGLDWARLVLREDARAGGAGGDNLGEPWAVPLQEARLSSFLAADNTTTTDSDNGPGVMDAFLSGQMTDLQSMMNVRNLVDASGKISEGDLRSFERLFDLLGLPQSQLDKLAENLRFALDASASNGSGQLAPLVPQRVEQLVWLGIPESTVAALKPYVTILPLRSPVNLNTASAEAIFASEPGFTLADAQRLVAIRASVPFRTPDNARAALGMDQATFALGLANVSTISRFFEVRSRLRLDKLVVEEH
ncbi:MAG TPA: type II secretion system minor pseudopilin GspK, partial [Ramlibacter sp.]|nr:type II secretion system minor pseudopilin GspK [Ramlibacter sp.]